MEKKCVAVDSDFRFDKSFFGLFLSLDCLLVLRCAKAHFFDSFSFFVIVQALYNIYDGYFLSPSFSLLFCRLVVDCKCMFDTKNGRQNIVIHTISKLYKQTSETAARLV